MGKIGATISGVSQVFRVEFTDSLGVLPGVGSAWIAPQSVLPFAIVTVTVFDGVNTLTIRDCRIDKSTIVRNRKTGSIVRFEFFDRRWKWAFGSLDGNYNFRNSDGTIADGRDENAQDLMTLALEEWGETGFDVSVLPDNDYPRQYWSCSDVRGEAGGLLERYGCDIAINREDSDEPATVVQRGVGEEFPFGFVKTVSYGVDFGEVPDEIEVCGGPNLYQSKLKLGARALEVDGTLVLPDGVSYLPDGGWEQQTDPGDLLPDQRDTEVYALANSSLYRIFAIESQADGTQDVPDLGAIDQIEQIVLTKELVEDYEADVDMSDFDESYRRPPFVQGIARVSSQPDAVQVETAEDQRLDISFRIDTERNLVIFSEPVYRIIDGELKPPDIYLTVAYNVIDRQTWTPIRSSSARTLASNDTPTYREPRPDVIRRVIARYENDDDPKEVTSTEDNDPTVDALFSAALDAIETKFESHESKMAEYVGIVPIQLDGAIQQTTYIIARSGANTLAYRNTEIDPGGTNQLERNRIYRNLRASSGDKTVETKRRNPWRAA